MAGEIFRSIYKTSPGKFNSTNDVNEFISKTEKNDLPIQRFESTLVSDRGNIFKYAKIDANKAFDRMAKKIKKFL